MHLKMEDFHVNKSSIHFPNRLYPVLQGSQGGWILCSQVIGQVYVDRSQSIAGLTFRDKQPLTPKPVERPQFS